MPKAKQKGQKSGKPRPTEEDSDDEYPGPSQTQSFTQAEKVLASCPEEEVERRVNELVQYLLIMDQKKVPIKRQEISRNVLKELSRAYNMLMMRAEDKLKQIFGVKLVELEGKQKSYILVNCLDTDPEKPHLKWPPEDCAKTGLIMVILSLIFMNQNVMADTLLHHTLKKLGIDVEHPHEIFGDIKKLIQEYVRQGYLECIRHPSSDQPVYEYKWGNRAKQETSKRNVLDFVCQIYDVEPQYWMSQYQDMLRSENDLPNGAGTEEAGR